MSFCEGCTNKFQISWLSQLHPHFHVFLFQFPCTFTKNCFQIFFSPLTRTIFWWKCSECFFLQIWAFLFQICNQYTLITFELNYISEFWRSKKLAMLKIRSTSVIFLSLHNLEAVPEKTATQEVGHELKWKLRTNIW